MATGRGCERLTICGAVFSPDRLPVNPFEQPTEVPMFKRRFRLPSPALVISMVTLSLVLGGTAVAASTATHSDKKADTKLIKKLAPTLSVKHAKTANSATNATNAVNATNAANATNATNATHATSATNATNATTAATALAPGTLAPGKTETGVYAIDYTAAGGGQDGSADISFAFPLAAAPNSEFIDLSATSDSNCPGTSANPTAAPGYLCVYAAYEQNVGSSCITTTAGEWTCGAASQYGAAPYVTGAAAGRVASVGTWAVTAPIAALKHHTERHAGTTGRPPMNR